MGRYRMDSAITVHGFTNAVRKDIAAATREHDFRALATYSGSYVLIIEEPRRVVIATSCDGARQYFYAVIGDRLLHGATVLDVLHEGQLLWRWNWRALGDLLALEHLVGDDTLHADIRRTPPASVLVFERGRLDIHELTFADAYPQRRVRPEYLVELTAELANRRAGDSPVLSLSGGFDSRLLLAALLSRGVRPRLLVAGQPGSTDRMVGEAMARRLCLDLVTVTLDPTDWLALGNDIVTLTGGTKPAQHWHTYIYTQRAGLDRGDRLIIGSNGELARSFYLDYGILSRLANLGPPLLLLRQFWRLKSKRMQAFRPGELAGVAEPLASELGPEGQHQRRERLVAVCDGGLLTGLDRFYLRERVRHFIGNGIALCEAAAPTITPMLDREWVSSALSLPRRWKLGNRWHRFAIQRLAPDLLRFPEEGQGEEMRRRPPALYWVRRPHHEIGWADYDQWFRRPLWLDRIRDLSGGLAAVIDRSTLEGLLREQAEQGGRTKVVSILFALAHVSALIESRRSVSRENAGRIVGGLEGTVPHGPA